MPTNFLFVQGDATVIENLTRDEIASVTTWQTRIDDYTFEFHEGHLTGNPVYFRGTDDTSTSNLPKVDTKQNSQVPTSITNGGKLSTVVKTDLFNIFRTDWTIIRTLARRYWQDEPLPTPIVTRASYKCGKCGRVFDGWAPGNANSFGKHQCTHCQKWEVKPL